MAALVGSTTALPFRDSTFDLVSATEVLEHLPRGERARAFSEFRRVTRELILVSVPYRENLSEELCRCGTCGKVFHRYGHLDRFEFSDLSELGGDATLEDAISIVPIQKSRRVRLLYWLKYRLGRAYQWDLSARCTYCGGPAERPRPNIIGRLASVLISEIDRLFPLREDGWLVARYREAKSHPASARPKSQS